MDCKVHGVTESDSPERLAKKKKRKSALEQEMATHSSVLAQRTLRTEEPGGLPTMGSGSQESDVTEATWQQPALFLPLV